MDREVKKEMEEKTVMPEKITQRFVENGVVEQEDDGVTLAQLSQTPEPKPKLKLKLSFTGNQEKRSMKNKERPFKIKKAHSDSKIRIAGADHARKCISCKKNKAAVDGLCNPCEPKSPAMIRAEEVQSNLEPAFPSFVKPLVRSHVASCFWMGLPRPLCKSHLPNKDCTIVLEDECGKQHELKYIADKTGLSAGWRQFSVGHNLLVGDVLVFQLVEPTKMKVYIIRANDLTEVDGALCLLNLDAPIKQNDAGNAELGSVACKKRKRQKSFLTAVGRKKNKKTSLPRSLLNLGQAPEQSENDSEEVGSEVLEGYKLSGLTLPFKEIGSFENFNILVDGLPIDSELSEDIRIKYYRLCCSQNAFLHENFIQGINHRLIVGTIYETVNIADAITACKLTTSRDEFAVWDHALKAFQLLGMNVGFLRARVHRLVTLAFESEDAANTRRYFEVRTERARTEDDIRNLEARLLELKEASERFDSDIEGMKSKAESYELKFQEEVTAPW